MSSCSKCGVNLVPVSTFPKRRRDDFPQMDNALVIDFRGGFGMYVDEPPTRAILCQTCTQTLFAEQEWIWPWIQLHAGNIY